MSCLITELGYYVGIGAALSTQVKCPPNTYQNLPFLCTISCEFRRRKYYPDSCVYPQGNFVAAFIALAFSALGLALYIVGGKLHRLHPSNDSYFRSIIHVFILLAACTIFGQSYSERGRKICGRVMSNYWTFTCVSLGFWDAHIVRDFSLKYRFKGENAIVLMNIIDPPELALFLADATDENMSLVAAIVAPRMVLI